uniref:Uncharacterized protein n=1 Tax=Arundo donax TaxID=35708 RepID=A0A0A8ZN42_ARUDO
MKCECSFLKIKLSRLPRVIWNLLKSYFLKGIPFKVSCAR